MPCRFLKFSGGGPPNPPSEVGSLRSVAPRLSLQNFSLGWHVCRPPTFVSGSTPLTHTHAYIHTYTRHRRSMCISTHVRPCLHTKTHKQVNSFTRTRAHAPMHVHTYIHTRACIDLHVHHTHQLEVDGINTYITPYNTYYAHVPITQNMRHSCTLHMSTLAGLKWARRMFSAFSSSDMCPYLLCSKSLLVENVVGWSTRKVAAVSSTRKQMWDRVCEMNLVAGHRSALPNWKQTTKD